MSEQPDKTPRMRPTEPTEPAGLIIGAAGRFIVWPPVTCPGCGMARSHASRFEAGKAALKETA